MASDTVGWVDSPEGRGTIDILFTNIIAIVVCVWTVLHHNIQAKGESEWTVTIRKLRWSMLAICAPEMLTLFAIMQWNAANRSVTEMHRLGYVQWTRIHAFFANAGGFILQAPDFPAFPINATSIHYLCREKFIELPPITSREIWDRSKADRIAKVLAFIQAGWLIIHIIARLVQKLPVMPFEVCTAAFIIPTLATLYFWSGKPQNVAEPTVVRMDTTIAQLLIMAGDASKEPYVDTPMDFVEKPVWEGWKRLPSLLHYGGLEKRPLVRIPNDYSPPPPTGVEATVVWVISVVHAMIHLSSWSYEFPTYMELLIWRVSSIVLLAVMVIGGLVPVLSTRPWFDFDFTLLWIWIKEAKKRSFVRKWIFRIVADTAYTVYIIARLMIFVEMFMAFRAAPADAYKDVSWLSFWPHV